MTVIENLNFQKRPKKNSVFLIELQIDKTGPRYNVNYENFELSLCTLFEKAISSTQSVPQLEKVKNIFPKKKNEFI